MAITPSCFPLKTINAESTTITQFPKNPKNLILQQCKTTKGLNQVHAHLIKTRLFHQPSVAEPLLECAALLLPEPTLSYALSILHHLENPVASIYNIMLRAFTYRNEPKKALLLFRHMIEQFVPPDEFTFSSTLKACSRLRATKEGKQIHTQILKSRLEYNPKGFVENSLIYMYASCGEIELARRIFEAMPEKAVFSWNSIFSGYVQCGQWQEVVRLFREMLEKGVDFDDVTLISVLTACGKVGDIELGEWICQYVKVNRLLANLSLVTSVLDMYAKCGHMDKARPLFDEMLKRDVVAWSAMISGYNQANRCIEALDLFHQMQKAKVEPNEVTMVSVLSSCAVLGALETGKWIHLYITKKKLKLSVSLGTALVNFYAKCGCLDAAVEVFNKMPSKNVWACTAMIQGLASNGQGKRAIEIFNLMLDEDIVPNDVTFIGVLTACSHAGFVDQGSDFFTSMTRDWGIEPRMEHYGCMVDILSRAGLVEEAYQFIKNMPLKPNAVIWRTLLASSRTHKNLEIAEESLKQVLRLEAPHSGDMILLSNSYASVGKEEDALRVRSQMKQSGVRKAPGCSLIEIDGAVHEFLAEGVAHPQSKEIYAATKKMMENIKLAGYVPNIAEARIDAEEDSKEASISHHSEKLAIAFGLLRTPPGTTIRISKNLRTCIDCHNASKVISRVYNRKIVIRDRNCFHHFKEGSCSCNDFW